MSSKPIPQAEFDKMLSQSKDGLIFKYANQSVLYVNKSKYCYCWHNGVYTGQSSKTQTIGSFWGFPTQAPQNTSAYAAAEKGNKPQTYALICKALETNNGAQVAPQRAVNPPPPGSSPPPNQDFNTQYKKKVEELLASKQFQSDLNEMVSRKYGSFVSDPNEGLFWIKVTQTPTAIFFDTVMFNDKSILKSGKWDLIEAGPDNWKVFLKIVKSASIPAVQGSDVAVANAVKLGKPAGLMTFLNASLQAAGKSPGSLTTLGAEADTASFWENHKNKFYIGGGIAMLAAVAAYGYKAFKERK